MFKVETTDSKTLKSAFDSISKIVDEITLTADSEKLRLRCLDRSHITFIMMDLDKKFFDEYQCDEPEKIAIDCSDFNMILKKCKSTDIIELTVEDSNLIIKFKGDATRTFKLALIDTEYDSPQPPHIDWPCTVKIPSGLLKEYIGDMKMFSEKLEFLVDEDYLKIRTDGQKGEANIDYLHGESIDKVVCSCFSVEKLEEIFRASKFSEECILDLGEDNPVRITFRLITGDGELRYLLAPRLSEED